MNLKALAFDTGGTVLDWHGGLVAAMSDLGERHQLAADWHEVVNDWRRRTMKRIVGQTRPAFNMDDVHRLTLDESLAHFGLQAFDAAERDRIWRTWHALDTWPDFPAALATLREALPVVSFTMLPTALVVDVSRRNGITWDAVISCEMIGVYKPHAEAYATAARWMGLAPAADSDGGMPQLRPQRRTRGRLPHGLRPPSRRVGSRRPTRPESEHGLRPRRR